MSPLFTQMSFHQKARYLFFQIMKHDLLTLCASVAFFAILSLPAIVILCLQFFSLLNIDYKLTALMHLEKNMGHEAVAVIMSVIESTNSASQGTWLRQTGLFLILLFTATAVFSQIQSGLNVIFGDFQKKYFYANKSDSMQLLYRRLICFVLFLALLILLGVSVFVSSFVFYTAASFPVLMAFLYEVVSFFFFAMIFAVIFWIVPDASIYLRSALRGGLVTSFLFTVSKFLIQFYLVTAKIGSEYGVASSVVIFMSWLFYAAFVFFVGAEFVEVHRKETVSKEIISKKKASL